MVLRYEGPGFSGIVSRSKYRQVEVVDAETGEEVTAFILTQIILEEAKKKTTLLPVSLLYMIIRYGETALSEFFDKYLGQTMKNYLAYKSTTDEIFGQWLNMGRDFSAMTRTMSDFPFNPIMDIFANLAKDKESKDQEGTQSLARE